MKHHTRLVCVQPEKLVLRQPTTWVRWNSVKTNGLTSFHNDRRSEFGPNQINADCSLICLECLRTFWFVMKLPFFLWHHRRPSTILKSFTFIIDHTCISLLFSFLHQLRFQQNNFGHNLFFTTYNFSAFFLNALFAMFCFFLSCFLCLSLLAGHSNRLNVEQKFLFCSHGILFCSNGFEYASKQIASTKCVQLSVKMSEDDQINLRNSLS